MDELVASGRTPGLLAYDRDRAVGWVSVAAKEDFGRLLRSPAYRSIDGEPVWSVVCFVVATDERGAARGVADALLHGAVDHARRNGATLLEAYPYDPPNPPVRGASARRGRRSLLRAAWLPRGRAPVSEPPHHASGTAELIYAR